MNQWYVSLTLLSLIQIWFYEIDPKKLARAGVFWWASVYLSLLACEFARKIFTEFQIEWWVNVAACLGALVIGESAQVLSSSAGKSIEKKRQSLPSLFSLSSLYVMFVWLRLDHFDLISESQNEMMMVATVSFLFLIILSGIHGRLQLYEVPKYLRGLPILAISASILLLIFLR